MGLHCKVKYEIFSNLRFDCKVKYEISSILGLHCKVKPKNWKYFLFFFIFFLSFSHFFFFFLQLFSSYLIFLLQFTLLYLLLFCHLFQVEYLNAKLLITDDDIRGMGDDAQKFMENFQYLRVEDRPEYGMTRVNLSLSTIHVPTYVYHKSKFSFSMHLLWNTCLALFAIIAIN